MVRRAYNCGIPVVNFVKTMVEWHPIRTFGARRMFDTDTRHRLFPVTRRCAYLNHAAVGPLPAHAREAACEYMDLSNSLGEKHWVRTGELQEELRRKVASLIGAGADEIAFTRNTSEGLCVLASGLDWENGDNVVLSAVEFPANVHPWLNLEPRGVQTRFVPLVEGGFSAGDVARCMDSRTRVVSVSSVQFYNGFAADIGQIGALCRERGAVFCVDAIQQVGATPLDVRRSGIDFLACGGHKWLMAGEGIGFLYCRAGLEERLRPASSGWFGFRNWEDFLGYDRTPATGARRFETGNVSAFGIWTLSSALGFIEKYGGGRIAAEVRDLASFAAALAEERGFTLTSPRSATGKSGIVSFKLAEIDADEAADVLWKEGVQAASRNGALRVSPHCYNTRGEIGTMFDILDKLHKSPKERKK